MFRLDQIERMHEHNTVKFIECIKTSHDICGQNNLVAIKVTALIRPSVLKKLNAALKSMKDRSVLPPLFELINQEQVNDKAVARLQQSLQAQTTNEQVAPSSPIEVHGVLLHEYFRAERYRRSLSLTKN